MSDYVNDKADTWCEQHGENTTYEHAHIRRLIASVIEDCAREAERVIAREIPCRCIDAYKDREMIDPNCSHHDAMDVATDIRALASPPPTPTPGDK